MSEPCCAEWLKAQESGTDNEGYGRLLNYNDNLEEWYIGDDLAAVRFCPWCGDKKHE